MAQTPRPSGTFPQVDKPARGAAPAQAPRPEQVALDWPGLLALLRCLRAGGMEADGDVEELARLRPVFTACDVNLSGRLERDEFRALCTELRLRPADAEAVFQRLDAADCDGAITFQEFARGFRGALRGGRRRARGPRASAPAASEELGLEPGDREEEEEKEGAAGDQGLVGDPDAPWSPARPGVRAWQDFQGRLGEEAKLIPRSPSLTSS